MVDWQTGVLRYGGTWSPVATIGGPDRVEQSEGEMMCGACLALFREDGKEHWLACEYQCKPPYSPHGLPIECCCDQSVLQRVCKSYARVLCAIFCSFQENGAFFVSSEEFVGEQVIKSFSLPLSQWNGLISIFRESADATLFWRLCKARSS